MATSATRKAARRWSRMVSTVALATLVGIGVGTAAHAHNQLTSSSPEDGEVLDEAPSGVTLDFLASLDPDTTTVTVTGGLLTHLADGCGELWKAPY